MRLRKWLNFNEVQQYISREHAPSRLKRLDYISEKSYRLRNLYD